MKARWLVAAVTVGALAVPVAASGTRSSAIDGININTGHSAAFSNDGKTLIFGHEPNGGTSPRCQATGTVLNNATYPVQTDDMKSFFFFDVASGTLRGQWTLPRDQTQFENCTCTTTTSCRASGATSSCTAATSRASASSTSPTSTTSRRSRTRIRSRSTRRRSRSAATGRRTTTTG